MTITGFQSYSFSAMTVRLSMSTAAATPSAAQAATTSDQAGDRVTLTTDAAPGATTAGTNAAGPGDAVSAPTASAGATAAAATAPPAEPPPSRAARRADALFAALDADDDGALTADEFTDGALNLLRNAGARRRIDEDGDGRRETRRLDRLERKLAKVFERVDANDDGAIDKNELTAALARTRGRHRHGGHHDGHDAPAPTDAPAQAGQAAGLTTVSISVTFVSVAVQRYAAVQGTAPAVAGAPDTANTTDAATPAIAA